MREYLQGKHREACQKPDNETRSISPGCAANWPVFWPARAASLFTCIPHTRETLFFAPTAHCLCFGRVQVSSCCLLKLIACRGRRRTRAPRTSIGGGNDRRGNGMFVTSGVVGPPRKAGGGSCGKRNWFLWAKTLRLRVLNVREEPPRQRLLPSAPSSSSP
jgi:hypothetical protein